MSGASTTNPGDSNRVNDGEYKDRTGVVQRISRFTSARLVYLDGGGVVWFSESLLDREEPIEEATDQDA
jgi:hypothetical protein